MDAEKVAWPVALVTAMAGGFWAWIRTRAEAKTSSPSAMVTAAGDFAEAAAKVAEMFGDAGAGLVKALNAELLVVRTEVADLRQSVEACESRHEDCERRVAESEKLASDLRAEFDAYVKIHPPADYNPSDLRRPGEPRP
jgi:hypothetical protein